MLSFLLLASLLSEPLYDTKFRDHFVEKGLPLQSLSFHAYVLQDRSLEIGFNSELAVKPGSVMKLITSISALELLGPNYRGYTELRKYGPISSNMDTPLVLFGAANADLKTSNLWFLLNSAYKTGIKNIPYIGVDRSFFVLNKELLSYYDEFPEEYYNIQPDSIFLGKNLTVISFDSSEGSVSVSVEPISKIVSIDSSLVTLSEESCFKYSFDNLDIKFKSTENNGVVALSGVFPKNCKRVLARKLYDNSFYTKIILQELWEQISGQELVPVVELENTEAGDVVSRQYSRTLAEVLRSTNKYSDTPLAKLVYLSIGKNAPQSEASSSLIASKLRVSEFLTSIGISNSEFILENGTGLSHTERLSPEAVTRILEYAYNSEFGPELLSTLPLAGVDGTLMNRMKTSPVKAKARIKSGTLDDTSAVAGYITDVKGRTWVLSAFINYPGAGKLGRSALDILIESIYLNTTEIMSFEKKASIKSSVVTNIEN